MAEILKVDPAAKRETEERWRKFEAKWFSGPIPRAKPKPKPKPKPTVTSEIEPKMAEAIQANPENVRLVAKAADGTVVMGRLRAPKVGPPNWNCKPKEEVIEGRALVPSSGVPVAPRTEVVAVDRLGRPARVWETDRVEGQVVVGFADYVEGQARRGAGVVSDYNPLDALNRD
jgi:hypothetical protein